MGNGHQEEIFRVGSTPVPTVLSNAGQSSPYFTCSGSSLFCVTFDDCYSELF